MSITLRGNSFRGPYTSISKIKDRTGVFVVIREVNNEYFVFDVGESVKVKTAILSNNNEYEYKKHTGKLLFYIRYTPFLKEQRIRIKQELRDLFQPICGGDKAYFAS
ncbi:MAG: hypothetical protein ACYC25_17660 [Paludibacter sp.]